jgi:predicted transglutaminase-like cysteine proteinase
MFLRVLKIGAVAAAFVAGWCATQHPSKASVSEAGYAAVGAETSVPYGWVDFCRRYPGECDGATVAAVDVNLTDKAMKEIAKVDVWVNAHVESVSDMDHWGVVDQWDYPVDGRGDCEDYALQKRKMLVEMGFPRQALLMTVVKDENQDGHAILTIKTNKGEYVLDNLNDEVKPWRSSGYRFVKRQSQQDPNVWVRLGEPGDAPLYTAR